MNGDSVNRLAETLTPFASQEKTVKSAGLIFLTINVDLSNSFLISYLSMLKIPLKICEMLCYKTEGSRFLDNNTETKFKPEF